MTNTDLLQSAQSPAAQTPTGKPDNLPEKFWDAKTGQVRLDALAQSYVALERKLSILNAPDLNERDRANARRLLGVPETPDGYCVKCDHGLFEPDADINAKLHAAEFTPAQAQLVYDMAAEKLVPLILQIAGEFHADREVERLIDHFGGKDRWREISRQLLAFGRRTLPPDVLDGLSASYEGVMALWRMMQAGQDPALAHNLPDGSAGSTGEKDLRKMMQDPKYWRERDPAFVAKVTRGFQDLYGGQ